MAQPVRLSDNPPPHPSLDYDYRPHRDDGQAMIDWLLDFEPTGSSIQDQMLLQDFVSSQLGTVGGNNDRLNPHNYVDPSMEPDNYVGPAATMQLLLNLRAPQTTGMGLDQLLALSPLELYTLIKILRMQNLTAAPYLDDALESL